MDTKLKVAAVQASPVFLDKAATIKKTCDLIHEAASSGARLVVFPESYVPGHPLWFKFMPYQEGMSTFYKRFFHGAMLVGGEDTDPLCRATKETGCTAVVGMAERDPASAGTIYNSQLVLGEKGDILGVHRKIMPTSYEKLVYAQGDGSTLKVFPTGFGGLGSLICGEHTNMLACYALLAMNEAVHAASWPPFGTKSDQTGKYGMEIRTKYHAYAGRVFAVSSCGIYGDDMLSAIPRIQSELISRGGGSAIIGPDGRYVAGPCQDREEILYGEIDLEAAIDLRGLQDITGHYNRFDIFKFEVDTRPRRPITFGDRPDQAARSTKGWKD